MLLTPGLRRRCPTCRDRCEEEIEGGEEEGEARGREESGLRLSKEAYRVDQNVGNTGFVEHVFSYSERALVSQSV